MLVTTAQRIALLKRTLSQKEILFSLDSSYGSYADTQKAVEEIRGELENIEVYLSLSDESAFSKDMIDKLNDTLHKIENEIAGLKAIAP